MKQLEPTGGMAEAQEDISVKGALLLILMDKYGKGKSAVYVCPSTHGIHASYTPVWRA